MNTRFNFDMRSKRGAKNGDGRKRRGADFYGDVWLRFRETVDHGSHTDDPLLANNGILTHGRGQQIGKGIINLAFYPDRGIM